MTAPILLKGLAWLALAIHPYYVSVTEVEHSSKGGTMGVSCKIFTDDLEEALKAQGNRGLDLVRGDSARHSALIAGYVRRHLRIVADGKALELDFVGYENDPEATWCYFEKSGVQPVKSVRIESDLLYETRKEQINIFHVTVDGTRKSHRLVNPDRGFEAIFK